jgi:hypothetical protein
LDVWTFDMIVKASQIKAEVDSPRRAQAS